MKRQESVFLLFGGFGEVRSSILKIIENKRDLDTKEKKHLHICEAGMFLH